MKLIIIFLMISLLQLNAKSYSQITIHLENSPLKEILSQVKSQGGYVFIANNIDLGKYRTSLQLSHASISEVLDACFKNLPLTYKLVEKTIVIKEKRNQKTPPDVVLPKNYNHEITLQDVITGKVTDTVGSPLAGVSVSVKGRSSIGTTTDLNGNFVLNADAKSTILVFSMVGFVSQEIPVPANKQYKVILKTDQSNLDEIVVVAFGKQKKSEVVGSVTSINPSELKVPSSNLTTALAGRVAGMIAYQRSGEPGQDNADFFIRGVTTFGYKKDPLILIDGIEVTTNDLARIQTDDIASFSIMKDATATSLYGSRAANGVIIITTKEGKEGKASISFRIENSFSAPTRNVELADPITYMRLNNEAVLTRNPLGILPYLEEKIDNTEAGTNPYMYPATDWREALFKNYTTNQRVNLNVSGGGQVARYYVAGSLNQDNGVLRNDGKNNFNSNINLKSYTLRSNVNVNLTKNTEMIVRMSGSFDDYTGPIDEGASLYKQVMRTNPVYFPAFYPVDEDHAYVKHVMFGNYDDGSGNYLLNPYAQMVRGYKNYARSMMSAQFEAKQKLSFLTEGLSARALLNVTRNTFFDVRRSYSPFWYQAGSYDRALNTYQLELLNEEGGTEYLDYHPGDRTVSSKFYLESAVNYSRMFHDKHSVSGMLVFMVRNELTGNITDLQSSLPFRNVGLAGRATYGYADRYYAEFNFGYNGSERFYIDNRYGFFPSAGVAWTISNEPFWGSLKNTVSNFKLRATYGLTGNDAIGEQNDRFLYLSNVNMNDASHSAVFGRDNGYSKSGISLSRYADPNISWETAKKTNLGLELSFVNRWNLIADFFKERRSGILMTRTATPATMGLSAQPKANLGQAESKGIDFSLDYNQSFSNSLWLQGRVNFTYAASKFLKYEEPYYDDAPWKRHVGYSINQQWGYIAERLFVDDEEAIKSPQQFGEYGGGDIKYHDVNKDGEISILDQVPIGYPTSPELVYGFGFSVGYKNFDFSAFMQGLGRESFWIDVDATAPFVSYLYENEVLPGKTQNQLLKAYADSHWSEENQNIYALWPRLSTTEIGNENNSQKSTWFMRNGAFLRVKQIEIGYTLPKSWTSRLYFKSFRAYINGTNLFTFSSFKLWDVEMAGNGLGYPIQRVFNVGINASF